MAAEIGTFDTLLPPGMNVGDNAFRVCARYYEPMDVVLYLQEDVAYRADRVDPFLTLLWHPYEDRAIGVKLKGFRWLFQSLGEILKASGVELPETHFIPLMSAIQVAMTAGAGAALVADVERDRLAKKYEQAKEVVANARFDASQLTITALAA